jgi:hypothetical protein
VARAFVLKSILFVLNEFFVTNSKSNPFGGIGFYAILENCKVRGNVGLHQCHLVLFVLVAHDLTGRVERNVRGLE